MDSASLASRPPPFAAALAAAAFFFSLFSLVSPTSATFCAMAPAAAASREGHRQQALELRLDVLA